MNGTGGGILISPKVGGSDQPGCIALIAEKKLSPPLPPAEGGALLRNPQ